MAIKGLVDTQAYVVGDYQAPVGYYSPARSVGNYVIDDYVITDYLLEALDLQSTFTIQAEGTVIDIKATLVSVFTLQAEGRDVDFASASLSAVSTIAVTPSRLRTGSANLAVTATQTTQGNAVFLASTSLDATATVSAQGNFTAASESISLTGFYTQTQVAGELFFGRFTEYRWDSFIEQGVVERTWDEWFGDRWDPGGVIFSINTMVKALGGYRAIGRATLTAQASQSQNITIIISKQITAVSTLTAQPNYKAGGATTAATEASASATGKRFRGVAIDGTPLDLQSVAQQTANANQISDLGYVQNNTAAFQQQTSANVVFDLTYGQNIESAFAQSTDANALFSPSLGLSAFNTQLSAGRIITIADPWNILTVPLETRTLVIPEDSRVTKVLQESRLNTIIAETRGLRVPQETRKYKIFKPVFTNRSSLPKVRSEL